MKRSPGAVLLLLGLVVASARGQTVEFYLGSDTALTILTGQVDTAELRVSGTGGVKAYSITIFLDRNRVDITAADTVPGYAQGAPALAYGTDSVVITASGTGTNAFTVVLARLTFAMAPTAQLGSLVSMRVNSLMRFDDSDGVPAHRAGIMNVCQAEKLGGDATGDRVINSRDALVALTGAVGLPVPQGFDLAPTDVDLDRQVTSRDALFILSFGIGLFVSSGDAPVLNKALPRSCAPLAPSPEDLLFFRGSALYGVTEGDTIPVSFTLPLAPYTSLRARWSPDRSRIVYTAYTAPYDYEVVATDASGTVSDTLSRHSAYDAGPDWSPDGTRIAFLSGRSGGYDLWSMNADGNNPIRLTSTVTLHTGEPVSWNPDGTRIAFSAYQTCCNYGLWVVNPDGTGLTEIVPGSASHNPNDIDWSAAGDSIYYSRGSSIVYVVPVVPGDTGRPAVRHPSSSYYSTASRQGVGYRSTLRYPYEFFLRRKAEGRTLRLTRGSTSVDHVFSFRRTGAVYVNVVTVSPDSVDLSLSGTTQQQFTATVQNSDGSSSSAPVTWSSRNPAKVTVDGTGLATAADTTTGTYIVATVRGWRSDSAKVKVSP